MGPLAALYLVATPFFGLQLQLQPAHWFAPPVEVDATLPMPRLLQAAAAAEQSDEDRRFAEAVRARAELGTIHRTMGIVTWASMTVTVAAGFIQYYNLYGLGAGQDSNP